MTNIPPVRNGAVTIPKSAERLHQSVVSKMRGGTAGSTYPGSFEWEIVKKNTVNPNQDKRNHDGELIEGVFRLSISIRTTVVKSNQGKIERNIICT
jgi:hypothetical protein